MKKRHILYLSAAVLALSAGLSGCGPDNDTPGIIVDDIYVAEQPAPGAQDPVWAETSQAGITDDGTDFDAGMYGTGQQGQASIPASGSQQAPVAGAEPGVPAAATSGTDGGQQSQDESGPGWVAVSSIAGMPDGGHAAGGDALEAPAWDGAACAELNGGRPFFDIPSQPSEARSLSALDQYGRSGPAYACIGPDDVRPDGTRREKDISGHLAGWTGVTYEGTVPGGRLYNNRRLIPWLQDRSSDGSENLLAATRYLSDEGLSPIEDMVSDYIARTGQHVAYRVTPVYDGGSLVCDGVVVEAASIGDGGEGLSVNMYCYNVQPGVEIDYWSGLSRLEGEEEWRGSDGHGNDDYVIDLRTGTFHNGPCAAVAGMNVKYREERRGTREDLIAEGYEPCGVCRP